MLPDLCDATLIEQLAASGDLAGMAEEFADKIERRHRAGLISRRDYVLLMREVDDWHQGVAHMLAELEG